MSRNRIVGNDDQDPGREVFRQFPHRRSFVGGKAGGNNRHEEMHQDEQPGGEEQTAEHRLQQEPVAAAPKRIVTGILPNADQAGYRNRIEYRSRIEYDHAGDGIHDEILVEAPRQPKIRRNENLASKTNELLKYGNAES
jgi:hypothetical protein